MKTTTPKLIWDATNDPANPGLVVMTEGDLWTLAPGVNHYQTTPVGEIDADEQAEIIAATLAYHGR